jgi:hypothetical protein
MLRKNFFPLFLIILFYSSFGNSQPITWYRTWGLPGYLRSEQGKRVCQTYDGGYAILADVSNGNSEWFNLLKYNSYGNLLWVNVIIDSNNYNRMLYDMQQTSDSGFIFAGWLNGPQGAFLVKTDKNGNLKWQRNYTNLNTGERFYSVQQTKDKGFIACGDYIDYSSSSIKGFVTKVDSLGYVQWEKWYLDSVYNYFNFVLNGFDKNYYIVGSTAGNLTPDISTLKKLDSIGNVIYTKIFYSNSYMNFILQLKDSSLILGGVDYSTNYPIISKYSQAGNLKWLKTYPSTFHFYFYYMCKDLFDNIIMTGGFDKINYAIIANWKIDTAGTVLKIKEIDFTGYSFMGALCIKSTIDSGYILTGQTSLLQNNDAITIKTDSGFNTPLITRFINDQISVYNRFKVISNYPNPFNSSTLISFYLPKNGFINFEIFNLVGKEIFSSMKYFYEGINEYTINFTEYNLSSGIYIVRVNFESQSKLVKLVYLK